MVSSGIHTVVRLLHVGVVVIIVNAVTLIYITVPTATITTFAFQSTPTTTTTRTRIPTEKNSNIFAFDRNSIVRTKTKSISNTKLYDKSDLSSSSVSSSNVVLASMGDWAAYLDEDRTGLIYYFNSRTGESVWEPPLPNFPSISLNPDMSNKAQIKQDQYVRSIEQQMQIKQQQQQQKEIEQQKQQNQKQEKDKLNLFSFLSDDDEDEDASKKQQQKQQQQQQQQQQQSKATKKAVVATQRKIRESTDWFDSVMQDVVLKRSTTSGTSTTTSDTTGLANRMKNDFFDKMFSNSRNVVSSVTNAISTSVDELKTTTNTVPPTADTTITTTIPNDTTSATTTNIPTQEVTTSSTPAITGTTIPQQQRTVQIVSYVLPHPDKILWGGEDAVFINGKTFGIFDGVSGATKRAGLPLYSKTLATEMNKRSSTYSTNGMTIPQLSSILLQSAEIADNKSTGASTALVASITTSDNFLRVLNVGDSKCIVIRNFNTIIGKSREISHYFECPYQLSYDSPDRPKDGTKFNIELQYNDLIIMASDGVFDNLNEDTIISIVSESLLSSSSSTSISNTSNIQRSTLQNLCKKIVNTSRKVSLDPNAKTPYAILAKRNNQDDYKNGLGGKLDDVSCIVARYA